MLQKRIRVRFAPSTTGPLHIGGLRTALYNYLFAKKYDGEFLLRIEDTDRTRYNNMSEKHILNSLKWCNIIIDKGIGAANEKFPENYKQSLKIKLYIKYAKYLVDKGYAYYAFDSKEELSIMKNNFSKNHYCHYGIYNRHKMNNSLNYNIKNNIKNNKYVIRLKLPILKNNIISIKDKLRGNINFNIYELEDKILIKSDGMPTYHFANVIDDHLMKITHVIRGEEWLSSTPIHVILYQYFQWDIPEFIHLPLILDPDKKGKLSKRNIDNYLYPIIPIKWFDIIKTKNINGFKETGILPNALMNWLILSGNKYNNEFMPTIDDMVDNFNIENTNINNIYLNNKKILWLNHIHIMNKNTQDILILCKELTINDDDVLKLMTTKIIDLIKNRCYLLNDFIKITKTIVYRPHENKYCVLKNNWHDIINIFFIDFCQYLDNCNEIDEKNTKKYFHEFIKKNNIKNIILLFRIIITGIDKGPDIFSIIKIIGKHETINRIKLALSKIN